MRRRTVVTAPALLAAIAWLAGCGGQAADDTSASGKDRAGGTGSGKDGGDSGAVGSGSASETELVADGVSRVEPPADAPVDAAIDGMTQFGAKLLGWLATGNPGQNVVLSPLSLAYAFAMVRAGAIGQTAEEIDRLFGFPKGVDGAFNALSRDLVSVDGPPEPAEPDPDSEAPPPVVAIANGAFVQQGFPIEPGYLTTLAEQYGVGLRQVDFVEANTEALKVINAWVAEQTADRIEKLFEELGSDARLVLANAVYLKASWATPFDQDGTEDEAFHTASGPVDVPMMRTSTDSPGEFAYAAGDGWTAVELPYTGGELVMRVLLPADSTTPLELLDAGRLAEIDTALESTSVALRMPRWDFATSLPLVRALAELGMPSAFDADVADFSGIHPGLYIGDAIHRANITVDEEGTEAAAVTGIAMFERSAPMPDVELVVDRPFAFTIIHKKSGAPLFIGQVADPRSK